MKKINNLAAPLRFVSKPPQEFVEASYALKSQLIGHIFVADS